MAKVSIVVPIYKVEDYLEECVNSVLSQTIDDFQLILVDDGSPDGCPEICEQYKAKDSRIDVIHKENGGLSSARNAAYSLLEGEFVLFLDSDDSLESHALDLLLRAQAENDADVVIGNYWYTYDSHEDTAPQVLGGCTLSGYEALTELVQGNIQNFAWGKLIRTSLAIQHPFPEGKLFEDHSWAHYILAEAKAVSILKTPLVHYRQREASISYTFTLKRLDMVDGWRARADYLQGNYPELLPTFLQFVSKQYVCIAWPICTKLKQDRDTAIEILRNFGRDFSLENYSLPAEQRLIKAFNNSQFLFVFTFISDKLKSKFKKRDGN